MKYALRSVVGRGNEHTAPSIMSGEAITVLKLGRAMRPAIAQANTTKRSQHAIVKMHEPINDVTSWINLKGYIIPLSPKSNMLELVSAAISPPRHSLFSSPEI